MIVLTITGRIYSKKNSRRLIRRGTRIISIPSKAYTAFQKVAVKQIHDQFDKTLTKPLFTGPVNVHTEILIPGRIRVDGDNLHTSLLDILEAANVIADDNNVIIGSYKKVGGSLEWGANIAIKDLTESGPKKYGEGIDKEGSYARPLN